ncbi:hypothetical protein HYS91_03485 [Candidatus Daviesbacteria bacterium]|nr:hypothetical protein [Candidatus Daviesbacteria bacterium]
MKTLLKFLVPTFLLWRLFLFLPIFIGYNFLPFRDGFQFATIWYRTALYSPVSHFLIYPWANFDGVHYLSIAGNGYIDEGRFFPFFPILINIVSEIFGTGASFGLIQFFVGFSIANTAFFLSLIVFYKLVRMDYKKNIAFWAIIYITLFPTSFFFASIYSESLFLLLLLLTFYFLRLKKWLWASIFALFLTITRFIGIAVIPILFYEFFLQEKPFNGKAILKAWPFFLTPLGIIGYSIFNYQMWGDYFYFIHSQGNLLNNRTVDSIVFPLQTLFRYFKILTSVPLVQYEWWIALLELGIFVFSAIILYLGWRKKIKTSYLLFSIFGFLIPSLTGTFSGLPRYVIILFPLFITLALIEKKIFKVMYISISTIVLFILLMFFSRGYFVA